MKKLRKLFIWSLVFLLLLTGIDQLLLRVPMDAPVAREVQAFYLDFRGRLFALAGGSAPESIDQVIEQAAEPADSVEKKTAGAPRYLYVDKEGALQFVDSLDEVPQSLRHSAQKLDN